MNETEYKVAIFSTGFIAGAMFTWAFTAPPVTEITPEMNRQMIACEEAGGKYTFNNCKW